MAARRLAWVTGAGSGIGRALAERLGQTGWRVAVSARTQADLDSLAVPGVIYPFVLDVTDNAAVAATVAQITKEMGDIDLVVLGAGIYEPIMAQGFDRDAFARTLDVNVMGTVNCLNAIMPAMIGRRDGHIAVMASVAGFVGLPGASAYGASKAALNVMAEALEPDLERHNVRISIINPGFVDTPLTRKNDFPMPFLITTDAAVDAIMRGLERPRFEIIFPWQMAVAMKLLALLPHRLRLTITRRMVR
ncbi:SDR family NAD(P)-dependent oxidoreductase [Devosia sp. ZB163]|uniref:SDR family NAD(P)-dependent oxidoreductase n=1 Tax=Devosia sp. ZB163 TaxID=3025938 RepID=UPI002360E6E9|nr:SDR family NAD(P)-dependent oxidoreductase [Devosia sp. ZB163]MDC9825792.1 SDR family NAD(P)-dependent oxidoreductase [Devosia sp. ZB163]